MSFPNVGRLVTPEEVVAFVPPMNSTIGVLETIVIESAEDMVEEYCQRRFEVQEYEDEQYVIRRPSEAFDGWITAARHELRLHHRPVTEFTSLKHVTQRHETTGEPVSPAVIPRNLYSVDLSPGIVIFGGPLLRLEIGDFPHQFFAGYAGSPYIELLATYEAGYEEIPSRLKLAVLMIIYRVYMMTKQQNWHRTQSQTTGAMSIWQEFIREKGGLTPEEKLILDMFKTPIAA